MQSQSSSAGRRGAQTPDRIGADSRSPGSAISPTNAAWTLSWRDRHLNWHRYDRTAPTAHVDPLLAEIDADPAAILWG